MNRLCQGDVGSGKTMAAAACIWFAVENGRQTALMAPTELLAQRHAKTLEGLLAGSGLVVDLLTGAMTAAQKRACRERLAAGRPTCWWAPTLCSARGGLPPPGPDRHRRAAPLRGGPAGRPGGQGGQGLHPHVLVMSATPIPAPWLS